MKHKIYMLAIILFNSIATFGQTSDWEWAESAYSGEDDMGNSIAVDASGNSYVTGSFSDYEIYFDPITLTNANADGYFDDIFVVKYDPTGKVVWAKGAGGTQSDIGSSISVDADGNLYVTGYFASPAITFGNTTLINTNTIGYPDIFIVKYDNSGTVIWAKSAGGANDDYGESTSVDATGNLYLTGGFRSATITFGNATLTNTDSSGFSSDVFVVKYDSSGNVLWTKSGAGINDYYALYGRRIEVDLNGNLYLTGTYSNALITFDSTTLTNTASGSADIFIVKYDPSGNVLWAKSAGGNYSDYGISISVDQNGNSYITGPCGGSVIHFDSISLENTAGLYIVKYDSSGNAIWANSASQGYGASYAITANADGSSFITGYFSSDSITFGSTILYLSPHDYYGFGIGDIFVVKYNFMGNAMWAKSVAGNDWDTGLGIAVDINGDSYITGNFRSNILSFDSITLTSSGGLEPKDFFVAKLNDISCELPANLSANNTTYNTVCLQWDAVPGAIGYRLKYKVAGTSEWTLITSTDNEEKITGLMPNTNYGWEVKCICSKDPLNTSDSSAHARFTTAPLKLQGEVTGSEFSFIEIYPNPVQNELTIKLTIPASEVTIRVYDLQGKMISLPTTIQETEAHINTSALPRGFYTLQITNYKTETCEVIRFLKQE
jgi:hypothetical protein